MSTLNLKPSFIFSLLLLFSFNSISQNPNTEKIYLSGTGEDQTVTWDFYCSDGMNSKKWSKIEVPSCWELQGFGTYNYGQDKNKSKEHGIYKTSFSIPKSMKGKVVELVFEGSMTDTHVKINGVSAGAVHQGAFYRFKYDISALLKYGKTNQLEVKVYKVSANESVNKAERNADYWVFGGIFRPVYLQVLPKNHIQHIAIDGKMTGEFNSKVRLNSKSKNAKITTQLYKNNVPFGVPIHNDASLINTVNIQGNFTNISTWNPESPELYTAKYSLYIKDELIHTVTEQFGFRTVEVRPHDGIYVNNKKVIMKGINRHSFWPSSGRTTSKTLSIKDVLLMKEMNMNSVRMSHYPPDKHFLKACDSLGLFVLDELSGWQDNYDTKVGEKLVKELVERDVNHPSIILWDNGNEKGWNTELDDDFGLYDIQKRKVVHPMAYHDGMDTQHYKSYFFGVDNFMNSTDIFFPTEFLHGLYDGGMGAGLEDYWNHYSQYPNFAGGFLWVFSDEGVVRTDKNGKIDAHGLYAPDGVVGPYREKEGSFYTVKELWSPVVFENNYLSPFSDGRIRIENRYLYTNLNQITLKCEYVIFDNTDNEIFHLKETLTPEDIDAGERGYIQLNKAAIKKADMLRIYVVNRYGNAIHTKTLAITQPSVFANRLIRQEKSLKKVKSSENDNTFILEANNVAVSFSKETGQIASVVRNGKILSFNNGPVLSLKHSVDKVELKSNGEKIIITITGKGIQKMTWEMSENGLLHFKYNLANHNGEHDYIGVSWNFPEEKIKSVEWLGDGPYRVWKNRMRGPKLGVWKKEYNTNHPGEEWNYPEFKGYHANLYWAKFNTTEGAFKIISATDGTFLRLYTPFFPKAERSPKVPFPTGDISLMHAIAPIGAKFTKPENTGPQGHKNVVDAWVPYQKTITGDFWFDFRTHQK